VRVCMDENIDGAARVAYVSSAVVRGSSSESECASDDVIGIGPRPPGTTVVNGYLHRRRCGCLRFNRRNNDCFVAVEPGFELGAHFDVFALPAVLDLLLQLGELLFGAGQLSDSFRLGIGFKRCHRSYQLPAAFIGAYLQTVWTFIHASLSRKRGAKSTKETRARCPRSVLSFLDEKAPVIELSRLRPANHPSLSPLTHAIASAAPIQM
jgi:hypothetical protein